MIQRRYLRLLLAIALAFLLVGGLTPTASAVDIRSGQNITIGPNEVFDDDLIVTGNNIVVNGTVNGNLIAAGSNIEVNGVVNGSLMFAGQSLALNVKVRDSVYGAGPKMMIGAKAVIGRNATYAGFGLQAEQGSIVTRDLLYAGYQAILNGEIGRDVRFAGAALELNGKVARDVFAEVDAPNPAETPTFVTMWPFMPAPVSPGLRVASAAVVGGKLSYKSPLEQSGAIRSTPAGGVAFELRPITVDEAARRRPTFDVAAFIGGRMQEFLTLFVLGLLVVWRTPTLLNTLADKARVKPLQSAGWGLFMLVAGFALAAIAALMIVGVGLVAGIVTLGGLTNTVFGAGFALLGFAFTIFMLLILYGSKLAFAYLLGKLALQPFAPAYADHRLWSLLVGVVLYVLVASIPYLDALVAIVATLIGLGAMWYAYQGRQATTAPKAMPGQPPLATGTPRPVMG